MHRRIATVLVAAMLAASCGSTKVIDGVEYDTYGLFDAAKKENPGIQYDLIWGNVVWGVILFECIVPPIYFFGFSLFEPVCKRDLNAPKGARCAPATNPR